MSDTSSLSSSSSSSSSSHSSLSPPIKPQIPSKPTESLKFGQKFQPGPIKVIHPPRRETESGLSSIDSRPSIRQKPKNSEFNLDLPKKPQSGQMQVKKLPSMKYSKNQDSSSDSLSSDSFSSSISKQKSPPREAPKKILEAKPLTINPIPEGPKVFKPVLNSVDLDDSPNILIKPSEPPIKPSIPHLPKKNFETGNVEKEVDKSLDMSPDLKINKPAVKSIDPPHTLIKLDKAPARNFVPPLPINKIEGFKVVKNPKEVKNFDIDSSEVDSLDSSSVKSSGSSKNLKFKEPAYISKPSKDSFSSSGSSKSETSSPQISDDLFQAIAIKNDDEEKNRSGLSKKNSIKVNTHESVIEEINLDLPPKKDQLLFSCNFLSYNQLLQTLLEQSFAGADFWESKSCLLKFCSCFVKAPDISPVQKMNLAKLENLADKAYDNDSEFHRNIFFSFYCRITSRQSFQMDTQALYLLGLSSFDFKNNELSKKFSLLIMFHQIYVFERKPSHLRKINEAKRPDNISLFRLLGILIGESFGLLKKRKLNCLFLNDREVIPLFFEFHTGLILIWSEIAKRNEEFAASIREAVDSAARNPPLCIEIYNRNG